MTDVARQIAELIHDHDADGAVDSIMSALEKWSLDREAGNERDLSTVLSRLRIEIDERKKSV